MSAIHERWNYQIRINNQHNTDNSPHFPSLSFLHSPSTPTPPSPLPANSSKARQSPPFQIRGISQHPSIHTHIKAYSPHYRLSQIYTHACLFSFAFSCRFSLLTVFLLIDIETLAEASKSNSCTIHSFVEKVDSLFQITFFYLYWFTGWIKKAEWIVWRDWFTR